ncbi:MAG: Elongation factor Ts [Phycisphaerae bacterium]|nr:Elongation factor Ts [Phycisphaerae bacterium]
MAETEISASVVMALRARTGMGMMACKKALAEAGGDTEKAVELLRKAGMKKADEKAVRETKEGRVTSYIHHNGKVGVLLEINCETDFVAKGDLFTTLMSDLCMHIAAAAPRCVRREEVPADLVEKEKAFYREEVASKPANIQDKIIAGKLDKWFSEQALLEQPFVKDDKKSVGDLIKEAISKTGENISVARFARFVVGG